jgi:hypothetical protein
LHRLTTQAMQEPRCDACKVARKNRCRNRTGVRLHQDSFPDELATSWVSVLVAVWPCWQDVDEGDAFWRPGAESEREGTRDKILFLGNCRPIQGLALYYNGAPFVEESNLSIAVYPKKTRTNTSNSGCQMLQSKYPAKPSSCGYPSHPQTRVYLLNFYEKQKCTAAFPVYLIVSHAPISCNRTPASGGAVACRPSAR